MNIIEKELEKIDKAQLCRKRVLLMGRIEHVKEMTKWLEGQNIPVEAVLDNDEKKQGLFVGAIPILAPEQVLLPFQEDIFILIYSPKYWEDMCGQFLSYGYHEGEHIYVLDKPGLEKNIKLVTDGWRIYRGLQKRYGKDVKVFLANCPLGDYYLLGLYFHQYCKENKVNNYVVVGESKGIEKLSPMLHIQPVQAITTEESNALIRSWIFLGAGVVNIKPLTLWQGAFRFNPCQSRQTDRFSFMETFTKMIYGLKIPVPEYPDLFIDSDKVETFFEENGLEDQKTVLISPFSYSLQTLPVQFWVGLAAALKENGYMVAVNVGEERERNFIPDTVELNMDFLNTMGVMERAGMVIGMRSGFFDITARARCRRIVLYPPPAKGRVSWNSTDIGFCSLKRMGLCGDAYEWEVIDLEETHKRILDILLNRREENVYKTMGG